ncbi:MAG: hypothetical protein OXF23_07775 [Candidatus Dadabacteria bacterium]|nr:hypothetical protein [Candidatus Dadabacteria bacterium]
MNVVGNAFAWGIDYNKQVPSYGTWWSAITWDISGTGTHSYNSSYILSSVSQGMDAFILKYLKANEKDCK